MAELRTVLVNGLVNLENGRLMADRVCIEDELLPLVGMLVQFVVHHNPPQPLDLTRWGGGCCTWQGRGECPAGHQEHPDRLLCISTEGMLHHDGSEWWVSNKDGRVNLPLEMLDGHYSRLVVLPSFDPKVLTGARGGTPSDLASMEATARRLRELLLGLRDIPSEG